MEPARRPRASGPARGHCERRGAYDSPDFAELLLLEEQREHLRRAARYERPGVSAETPALACRRRRRAALLHPHLDDAPGVVRLRNWLCEPPPRATGARAHRRTYRGGRRPRRRGPASRRRGAAAGAEAGCRSLAVDAPGRRRPGGEQPRSAWALPASQVSAIAGRRAAEVSAMLEAQARRSAPDEWPRGWARAASRGRRVGCAMERAAARWLLDAAPRPGRCAQRGDAPSTSAIPPSQSAEEPPSRRMSWRTAWAWR